jgi:hypothetical protein
VCNGFVRFSVSLNTAMNICDPLNIWGFLCFLIDCSPSQKVFFFRTPFIKYTNIFAALLRHHTSCFDPWKGSIFHGALLTSHPV